ncbi:hypothetical protein AB0C34_10835 [Nocardia sp. NPDC049220]|uniref:hypothetical protein n=1 Tax=Nocardia sp. NPDC049220 TaxID=3155273 RepID=UPI0033D2FDC3
MAGKRRVFVAPAFVVAVGLLVIGAGGRSSGWHRIRNVVNGFRGAHAARARHRRTLRARAAGIGRPREAAVLASRAVRTA